jgi:uncharacterized protein (TIGR02147 family)
MNEITTYTDYRLLLRDYYEAAKARNQWFSFRTFSQKAGITSTGLLCNVIGGKRRLSPSHVVGLARAMHLTKGQFEYFENLVNYNNARNMADKQRYFERMASVKVTDKNGSRPQIIRKEQYLFYSQWYHSVIRSLIDLYGFEGDYKKLARSVYPPITVPQAKKSVALLESLGFIATNGKGAYRVVDKAIASAPELLQLAVHSFHRQTAEIACKALNELPWKRRNFSGVTLGISASAYDTVCKKIEDFRIDLLELASRDTNPDEKQGVYHLNLQLFSVSQDSGNERNQV